ncbi:MAG: hypothetical protein ACRCUE_02825 [Bosea sp. (in: a-proteobacteria)]
MIQPVIIGIHGLNNKPMRATLRRWWLAALAEGYDRNIANQTALPEFQLSYWADLCHDLPYTTKNDPEPYRPADGQGPMPDAKRGKRRKLAALGLEAAGKLLDTLTNSGLFEERLEHLIESKANDLHRYHSESALRAAIRARLASRLQHAMRQSRPVLLIAHSMGSIIAYDVLRANPALLVSHIVTIGSPLGLDEIKNASSDEFGAPRIPDGVSQWTNLADPRDRIAALDMRLASDYDPGQRCLAITDRKARNEYVGPNGRQNPHKVYGYLRTPEMSRIIAAWLTGLET